MTENEIVRRCQEGDLSAFKQIYERYEQPLLNTALRMLGQQQDAEDAVQVTFTKLYRGVGNFRFQAKFSTYLFRILMNVCYEQLAKKKKMKLQELDTVEPSHNPGQDLRLQIDQAISQLPGRQKACFVLFAIEGLKQFEISDILGMSLGGVKANIFHAKKRLRVLLSDDQFEVRP